ncbi:MAG: GGDEF domain-containing protein [Planctomycetota bacterium]
MNTVLWITLAVAALVVVQLFAVAVICRSLRGQLTAPAQPTGLPAGDLHKLARRVHRLTHSVADDVGEHHKQIDQLHDELTSIPSLEEQPVTDFLLSTVSRAVGINEWLKQRLTVAEERLQQQARDIECHISEARTDALTGLPNRRAFDDELARRVAEARRKQTVFSLMMLDADRFKLLNDRYGHQAGDDVLRHLAKITRNTLREMDMIARYGGEEFAVILPMTCGSDGKRAVQRIGAKIAESKFQAGKKAIEMTVSIGLSVVVAGDSPASLIQRADDALYASKRGGRNCGHFFDGHSHERIVFASDPNGFGDSARSPNDELDLNTICEDLRARLVEVVSGA